MFISFCYPPDCHLWPCAHPVTELSATSEYVQKWKSSVSRCPLKNPSDVDLYASEGKLHAKVWDQLVIAFKQGERHECARLSLERMDFPAFPTFALRCGDKFSILHPDTRLPKLRFEVTHVHQKAYAMKGHPPLVYNSVVNTSDGKVESRSIVGEMCITPDTDPMNMYYIIEPGNCFSLKSRTFLVQSEQPCHLCRDETQQTTHLQHQQQTQTNQNAVSRSSKRLQTSTQAKMVESEVNTKNASFMRSNGLCMKYKLRLENKDKGVTVVTNSFIGRNALILIYSGKMLDLKAGKEREDQARKDRKCKKMNKKVTDLLFCKERISGYSFWYTYFFSFPFLSLSFFAY